MIYPQEESHLTGRKCRLRAMSPAECIRSCDGRDNGSSAPEKSATRHFFCFLMLGVLMFWCAGCGENAPVPAETTSPGTASYKPYKQVQCESSVDGMTLEASLYFPEGFDHSHPRSWVAVLPGVLFPEEPHVGQAVVVRLHTVRPSSCPSWVVQEDTRSILRYVAANFAVDPRRLFLAGGSASDVSFACEEASHLAGVYLRFPEDAGGDFTAIPLRNLLNLPVYLDESQNRTLPPTALNLEERMRDAGAERFFVLESLFGGMDADAALSAAFIWLGGQSLRHESLLWEAYDVSYGEAWWLRLEQLASPERPGVLSARMTTAQDGTRKIDIHTRNLDCLSLQSSWEGFPVGRTLLLEVDGRKFSVQAGQGWIPLMKKKGTGLWEGRAGTSAIREKQPVPLWRVLSRPFVLVPGTLNAERRELWKNAAETFAGEWAERTGIRPLVRSDEEITADELESRNVILLGSPSDNCLTESVLENDSVFLRNLFLALDDETKERDDLASLAVYPGGKFGTAGLAMVVTANACEAIPHSLQPLLDKQSQEFLFHAPGFRKTGFYSDEER